ncbi:MAG: SDR family oxidoreductase [Armatimonadota bacterium]|nr:SDR family oxidoreductase [Armatimonadota bacterium]
MAQTAFVTGSTDFLGLNLIQQLTEQGWQVTALHRPASNLTYLKRFPVTFALGEIEDAVSLEQAMPEGLDAVFHVAGNVSFWSGHRARQMQTNVEGTRNMVATARRKGAKRFIHTSSIAVYGVQPGPFDETAPHLGKSSWIGYLSSKALAEDEVRAGIASGLDAVLLNPANIVGPYDLGNWSRLFRLVAEAKLPGIPPGRAPFCHVAEVAKAHVTAFERGRTGENYILAGTDATYAEAFAVVGRLLNHPVPDKPIPAFALKIAGRLSEWGSWFTHRELDMTPEMAQLLSSVILCRSDKAERELGYRAVPLQTMFEDCYRWLLAEGLGS